MVIIFYKYYKIKNKHLKLVMQPKKFIFKNNQNQKTEVNISINRDKITISAGLNENILSKKFFRSTYTLDEVKEKNKFFFLCQGLNDVLNQLEILLKDNNNATFRVSTNQMNLKIPTNMPLAPEILFDLTEIEKDDHSKIEELTDYIVKSEENYKNIFASILKENKEMKEKIISLETRLNLNFGILPEKYFDRIKEWIGGDKKKLELKLIFKLGDNEYKDNRFNECTQINFPLIFIFITSHLSIFGSYCPCYYMQTSNWINDANAFLFSLNLNKKYPAKVAKENYLDRSYGGGYRFKDIEFTDFKDRIGQFNKSGVYLDKYELEGDNEYFFVKHFLIYKILKNE